MNRRTIIFIVLSAAVLSAGVWLALADNAAAPADNSQEYFADVPDVVDAPDSDFIGTRPAAHASVRVMVPARPTPGPEADVIELDRPIVGMVAGRRVVFRPGFYRIYTGEEE